MAQNQVQKYGKPTSQPPIWENLYINTTCLCCNFGIHCCKASAGQRIAPPGRRAPFALVSPLSYIFTNISWPFMAQGAALLPLALAVQGPVRTGQVEAASGRAMISMISMTSKSSPATEHLFPDGSTAHVEPVEHT